MSKTKGTAKAEWEEGLARNRSPCLEHSAWIFFYLYSTWQLFPGNNLLVWTERSPATCCCFPFLPAALCQTEPQYGLGYVKHTTEKEWNRFFHFLWLLAMGWRERPSATENSRMGFSFFFLKNVLVSTDFLMAGNCHPVSSITKTLL